MRLTYDDVHRLAALRRLDGLPFIKVLLLKLPFLLIELSENLESVSAVYSRKIGNSRSTEPTRRLSLNTR